MFHPCRSIICINVDASSNDDVAIPSRVDFSSHTVQSSGHQNIVGIEKAENVARGQSKTLVDRVCLASIGFPNDAEMWMLRKHIDRIIR